MATLDFNMDGVKPAGEFTELGEGEYFVRIEGTEKKGTKDKFYENGTPHEDNGKNFYLNIGLRVGSGPNEGHVEFERLNLWNTNAIAVGIAKSTMLSIQQAINVFTNNSDDWNGKFMVMRIKKNSKGVLGKHYEKMPPGIDIVKKEESSHVGDKQVLQAATSTQSVASTQVAASSKPSWAV